MELPGFSLLAAASLFATFCCYKRQQGRFIFFMFYLDYTKIRRDGYPVFKMEGKGRDFF